jgi:hypothetical protein
MWIASLDRSLKILKSKTTPAPLLCPRQLRQLQTTSAHSNSNAYTHIVYWFSPSRLPSCLRGMSPFIATSSLSRHTSTSTNSHRFNAQPSQRQRLFATYDESRQQSQSPSGRRQNGYVPYPSGGESSFAAYPSSSNGAPAFRSATPNSKGQYSDAVLSELESQNDEQLAGISGKVRRLKDVSSGAQ